LVDDATLMASDLRRKITEMNLHAEFLDFDSSVHTVEDAAKAAGVDASDMNKNLLLVAASGMPVIAVLSGTDHLDLQKLETLIGRGIRMAKASEVSKIIGFDAGAVPVVGINATVVVDPKATQKAFLYSSGGSTRSLVRIQTDKFLKSTKPIVGDIAVTKTEK
jgi:Cys-tRNA(Pro)/Cys-tRNA(Cys) deacylase